MGKCHTNVKKKKNCRERYKPSICRCSECLRVYKLGKYQRKDEILVRLLLKLY